MNQTMTKAILDGSKTQTRRILPLKNKQLGFKNFQGFDKICALFDNQKYGENYIFECIPLSLKIGDEFWIRESVEITKITKLKNKNLINFKYCIDGVEVFDFEIPQEHKNKKWIGVGAKIPNGCLKEMARLYCVVTDINISPLQDISIDNIIKEGYNNKEIIHNFEYNDQLSRYYNKKWASHVVNDKEKAAYYDELGKTSST